MWSVSRRVVASAVVTALASSLAVASAATADPLDPVYAATLSLSDGAMWCSDWPVLEDGSWTVGDGRGPAWDTFRVTSSVANIDGSLSADDYRIIFTLDDEAVDGVGYHVDGSDGAPGVPRPDGDDGAVRAEWYLPMSAPLPNQIGVKLIGLNEDSQWVEVYQGSIPVINGCLPPTQQVGAPDELVLGDALTADRRALLVDWLERSTTGGKRVRAALPTSWRVADKTGTGDYGRANDIAIVWPPHTAPLVLAVMSDRPGYGTPPQDALIAEATKRIVSALG